MSLLRYSAFQRRNSMFNFRKPCSSYPYIKKPKVLPKLLNSSGDNENSNSQKEEICNINSKCTTKVFTNEPIIDNELPKSLFISSNLHILRDDINIPSLPRLPTQNDSSFNQIFAAKIKLCSYIFDFSRQFQINAKNEKFNALIEINALLSRKTEASLLSDQQKNSILEMIKSNIFDQDPFLSSKKTFSFSCKPNYVEQSWEHLTLVFKMLNQFVLLFPEKCPFELIKNAIRLMNIPDSNEGECFVTFLKNYTKVHPNQFDDIWKQIKIALINVRYDIYTVFCLDPILSYISNTLLTNTTWIRDNYIRNILHTHLLPLFENEKLSLYFTKLSNLITQVVDGNLTDQVNTIKYLIGHFPVQCGQKQPLFISALISITNSMKGEELCPIAKKLFVFIAMSLRSPNSKSAEYALSFLLKPNVRPIIYSNYELAMETLYDPLKWSSANYWDNSIKEQSSTVLSTLMKARQEFQHNIALSDFVDESENKSQVEFDHNNTKKSNGKDLAQAWGQLSRVAARRDNEINLTKILLNIQIQFVRNENCNELLLFNNNNQSSQKFDLNNNDSNNNNQSLKNISKITKSTRSFYVRYC